MGSEFKIKKIEFIDESDLVDNPKSNLKYNDIEISIGSNSEESLEHIQKDYEALRNEGIEKLIKEHFIPWLKGEKFKDLDDDKIYDGLKITNITYHYQRIIGKYSPTNEDDFFGEFDFDFESSNDYTRDLLQASALVVLVNDEKVYYDRCYDI